MKNTLKIAITTAALLLSYGVWADGDETAGTLELACKKQPGAAAPSVEWRPAKLVISSLQKARNAVASSSKGSSKGETSWHWPRHPMYPIQDARHAHPPA